MPEAFLGARPDFLGDVMATLSDKMTFEYYSENLPPTNG